MITLLSYGKIMLSCVVVYIFIIAALRLFGKKELTQLSVLDLVFILLISNSVQNAMVGSDASLSGGLIAATSLFIANYIFKMVLYNFPKLSHNVQGHPILLVYRGQLIEQNLKKIQLTLAELKEAIRSHGEERISDIDQAVFEVNGNISIISKGYKRQTLKKKNEYSIKGE